MIVKHFICLIFVTIGIYLLISSILKTRESTTNDNNNAIQLRSNNLMPIIGIGTAGIHGDSICQVMLKSLQIGFRLIDSAAQVAVWYQNEKAIGDCIAANAIDRKSIFLTTKLHPQDHGSITALVALKQSLSNLRTDYIDLYICK